MNEYLEEIQTVAEVFILIAIHIMQQAIFLAIVLTTIFLAILGLVPRAVMKKMRELDETLKGEF